MGSVVQYRWWWLTLNVHRKTFVSGTSTQADLPRYVVAATVYCKFSPGEALSVYCQLSSWVRESYLIGAFRLYCMLVAYLKRSPEPVSPESNFKSNKALHSVLQI